MLMELEAVADADTPAKSGIVKPSAWSAREQRYRQDLVQLRRNIALQEDAAAKLREEVDVLRRGAKGAAAAALLSAQGANGAASSPTTPSTPTPPPVRVRVVVVCVVAMWFSCFSPACYNALCTSV
jgi:hypothetical protein